MAERARTRVELGHRSYDVVVDDTLDGLGAAVAATTGAGRCVLVTEPRVAARWGAAARASLEGAGVDVVELVLDADEAHKDLDTWWSIVDGLLTAGVDRRTPVVALGGGVLGDLAGFAAATTLRGLPFVQVPTTLLAMVDSSVGGKTGFNHARGKNLVGAFHQPVLVWAALQTLTTLPAAERSAGLGEVVKTALLGDADLLDRLGAQASALRAGDPDALGPVIARCAAIKAEVVAADEREGGWRAVLNAGHTVGHGLETAAGHGVLPHGVAVALGLLVETRWAVREGHCDDPGLPDRLATILADLGLPTVLPELDHAAIVAAMGVDKKTRGAMLTLPVPVRAGSMTLVPVPVDTLGALLAP